MGLLEEMEKIEPKECVVLTYDAWRKLMNEVAQLEEIKAAAQIIFEISDKASFKATSIECPHGNIPSYPTHAWWCDKCFFRLKEALGGES